MKRLKILLPLLFLARPAAAALNVVATTEDLASIASEVGGKRVKVRAIAKGYQDPHFIDAKPSYLLALKRADLFLQIGLELESAWAPSLLTGARNRKILPGSPGFLDASSGCRILERAAAGTDRSAGDVHPEGNPHYWLDPANGRIIAENIAGRLARLDPNNAAEYAENLQSFKDRLARKQSQWAKTAERLKGLQVVTYHNSWPNFAERFGLTVADFIEPKPGIPASPAHVRGLIERMRREKIRVILIEPYFDSKLPEKIAAQTGAKLLVIPPSVGADKDVASYFSLFDNALSKLAASGER